MKIKLKFFFVLTSLFVMIDSFSQNVTNISALKEFSKAKLELYQKRKAEAIEYAERNSIPIIIENGNAYMELMYINEYGEPVYYITENLQAAQTISTDELHSGGSSGLNLTGDGMILREWDAGAILTTHVEFGSRVTQVDNVTTHWHSTHVAGTLIASGVNSNAEGMAPNSNLRAFDWNNDVAEMADEAINGALISNHSYGINAGWWRDEYNIWHWAGNSTISNDEDFRFGFYDDQAQEWDQTAFDAPFYLIVKSAGNDRGQCGDGSHPCDGPYDCIPDAGNSKNVLTVGAINEIPGGYTNAAGVVMSNFSSWGPSDDGRIKPDIVANGVNVFSTDDDNNNDYNTSEGTSMAAPSVAGSMILLQQHYRNTHGANTFMRSATLKALVIHTADEAGNSAGPDYQFGWGLMNSLKAAKKISEDQNLNLNVIDELTLNNGGSYQRTIFAKGGEPIKVTICWTDTPGTPPANSLDPANVMLVNDLDLRIVRGSSISYPWSLNRITPENAATNTGENNVDNVEVVIIDNPTADDSYNIIVDHDGSLTNGSMNFSIIISGINQTFDHDYKITNLTCSPANPIQGQTVTVNATLKNVGLNTEASGQQVKFFVDGAYSNSTTTIPSLAPDATTPVNFSWIAINGAHNLKVQCYLNGDQNSINDFKEIPIYVGVAGNLIIDGTANPVKNLALSPASYSDLTLQLQNTGSAAINGTVTKGGAQSAWVTLTSGTTFSLNPMLTSSYNYRVTIPSGTALGNYNANITFNYNGGSNVVTLNINVVQYDPGNYQHTFTTSNTLINGSIQSTTVLTHYFNNLNFFNLDNDPATSYPTLLDNTKTLTDDEYNRVNFSNWTISSAVELESWGTISHLDMRIPETSYTNQVSNTTYYINLNTIEKLNKGLNTFRLALHEFVQNAGDVTWDISNSQVGLRFSQAAWASSHDIPQTTYIQMQAGLDYCRLYFDVVSVNTVGDLLLFNNGKQVDYEAVSSTGNNRYFTLSSSEFFTSNYFNIKGDYSDNTRVTISNIRLVIHYFMGDPNLVCTKTLNLNSSEINQNVTVNLSFQNIGTNIADEPFYNDSPLPSGLTLVSGSLSGDPGDVDPGLTETTSYIIKGSAVGNYTFGATNVVYENPSGSQFSSTFNAVNLTVNGGNLVLNGQLDNSTIGLGGQINISASVVGSILNNNVIDAQVLCNIMKPDNTQIQFYLLYNQASQLYTGTYNQTDLYGLYQIGISAVRQFYNDGVLTPQLTFEVIDQSIYLIPDFVADNLSGNTPLIVNFTDYSFAHNTTIASWYWEFGDGSNSMLQNPQHIFENPGSYIITLTISDGTITESISKQNYIVVNAPPIITVSPSTLSFGNIIVGYSSTSRSYIVTGSNLTTSITVNAPTGFAVSGESTGPWTSSISLPQTGGNVYATVYVRFIPTSAVIFEGNIINASTGAITQTVFVSGTGVDPCPVSVIITPSANPVCSGTSVTFTSIPTNGGSSPVYQWKRNGTNVGTNNPTYTLVPNNNDLITCELTSSLSCATGNPATSNPITMTVNPLLPVSVAITASANPVCSGTSVTFAATPTNGGTSPVYQWKRNGTNVGTNSQTYILSPNNNDIITCVLTSNLSCATGNPATSNSITMTVNPLLPVSVAITASANPVCSGTSVTYTATPTNGGSSPVYQWKRNGTNVGTNSQTYILSPNNNDIITCVLTSNLSCATGNPATSNPITMTVNPLLPVSVAITASANPVCSGTSVTFTATPTNGGTSPTYQWKRNGTNVGTNSQTYILSPNNNDIITCELTSNLSCATGNPATSNPITMTVNPLLPVSVAITASANPVCSGTSVTFRATPTNGGSSPVYQWKRNGTNVGTNSQTYILSPNNNDIITCVLTSNLSCATGNPATSNPITMTVNPLLPVSLAITASANPVCSGTSVTFTATPTNGGSSPVYQWKRNGTNVGTNSQTYILSPNNNDLITCVLTSNLSCATGNPATSNPITMTVNPLLPVSLAITASANPVCSGASVTFTATPTNGGTSPVYQWKRNGTNVGTNSPTFILSPNNNDIITCVLTSNLSCATGNPATSNPVTMTVNPLLPVSVAITASANPVCSGTSVTFTATPTNGGTSPVYQWKRNGTNVGTNSPTYILSPNNNDIITCVLTSDLSCATGNPATSNSVTMTVISVPSQPDAITGNTSPGQGTTEIYNIQQVSGASAYTWTLPPGWSGSSTTNSITATVGATGGTISVTASNACGTSPASTLNVNVTGTPTIIVSPQTLAFGNVILGSDSPAQSYNVQGSNLTTDILVTAPAGFSASLSENGPWSGSLPLLMTGGIINTTVYVRFSPTSATTYSGNITHTSAGATTQNVAVSGTGTEAGEPSITVDPPLLSQTLTFTGNCPPAQTYTVSASNLIEDLTIYVHFEYGNAEISLTGEEGDYHLTLTLVPENGAIPPTVIYVRNCPFDYALIDYYSAILNSSSGITEFVDVYTYPVSGNAPITTIANVTAEPGELVNVPVTVSDFNYLGQVQYVIEFDPTVLTFQDLANIYAPYNNWTTVQPVNSNLAQLYINLEYQSDLWMTIPDNEKLFDLVFSYTGGSSSLNFGDCSFYDSWNHLLNDEPASTYYINGSVSQANQPTIIVSVDTVYFDDILMYNWSPPSKYSVSGFNLNSDLVITTTSYANCYKLSRQSESGYSDSVILPQSNGIVENTEIFIKQNAFFNCLEPTYIIHSSAGTASNEIRIINRPDGPQTQDAPRVFLGIEGALSGSPVVVPVIVENFQHLSAIFLAIEYNPAVISFEDYIGYSGDVSVNEITVSPDTARLQIYIMRSTSDVTLNLPDFSKLIEIEFNYLSGATDLVFIPESYFLNHQEQELDDEPYPEHYFNGSVGPFTKNINLTICLEGLYNEAAGFMNKAQHENGNMFPGIIADRITVKLAKSTFPYNFISVYKNLELNQDKTCTLQLPANMDDEYYLVINHRNSLETWSANPVAFGSENVYYNFTQDPQFSYGGNVKLLGNSWCIYGGDVNQDGVIDTGDMTPVDNDASSFATGYLSTDVNGDGVIDTGDMTIVDNNTSGFISASYPLVPPTAVVETTQITPQSGNSVICSGKVTYQGSTMVTQRGVCWSTSPEPDYYDNHVANGIGLGAYNCQINGLTPNTQYYFRAYAYNGTGFSYGNELSCITPVFIYGEGVIDFDGNSYTSVIIGTQEWMAENLKVTHYNNGDIIPIITDNTWINLSTGAMCWYENDEATYTNPYGALYNYYTVADSRNLCPAGWHVPSDTEWAELIEFLGGANNADEKLKEAGFEHWNPLGFDADNSSGFTGLPGGRRTSNGAFSSIVDQGFWWSTNEATSATAWGRSLGYNFIGVVRNDYNKKNGNSVRCLKTVN